MVSVITYIQNLSFKLINFIFGKTTIFIVIIGWYLIVSGFLFLVKPEKAREKLAGSGFGIVKLNIMLICFFLWGVFIKLSQAISGILQTIVFFAGLVGLVWFFLWAKQTAKKMLVVLAEKLPLNYLKLFCWAQVIAGGLMVLLQRRLW